MSRKLQKLAAMEVPTEPYALNAEQRLKLAASYRQAAEDKRRKPEDRKWFSELAATWEATLHKK
jgi:hypothetical protein